MLRLTPLLALAPLVGCRTRPADEAPFDVVVVALDGLRADRLSLFGNQRSTAPAVEALARESVTYARAVSPATWSVPAVASISTGRWPSWHGAERLVVPGSDGGAPTARAIAEDATTLAEILAREGFRTAAFVGNGDELRPGLGFARGFSHFDASPDLARGGVLAAHVADWLARHSERSFVFASIADGRDGVAGGVAGDSGAAGSAGAPGSASSPSPSTGGTPSTRRISPGDAARYQAEHDARVEAADRALGLLVRALRRAGRWEHSLVVVVGDHGELLGEHGMVGHGRPPFEPGVRVPLLVKLPSGRRGGEWVERRVSTLGVFATVLDQVGATPPDGVQSRRLDDLHPVWVEEVDREGRRMRAGYDGLHAKVLVIEDQGASVACAIDLLHDPGETRPDCKPGAAGPLDVAMRWFGERPRPVRVDAPAPESEAAGS
ncbi:MAG: sulfatase [Alphaproteobacteria bacterium]